MLYSNIFDTIHEQPHRGYPFEWDMDKILISKGYGVIVPVKHGKIKRYPPSANKANQKQCA